MVLFLRYTNSFRYIPENESKQDILGWNTSNINANPGLSFSGKLSHRDANHNIFKGVLIELHLSGYQGWTHGPGSQSYTPRHKLPFLSLNISLLLKLLKCGYSKNYSILSFSWIFQPSVNSIIPKSLGDGLIILIFMLPLYQADNN